LKTEVERRRFIRRDGGIMEVNTRKIAAWLIIIAFILLAAWGIYLSGGINTVWIVGEVIFAILSTSIVLCLALGVICWAIDVIIGGD
jgi:quinol-cytochrome oxidoreductase complex cytochrome b subunit